MLRRHLGYSVGIVGCGIILLALLGFLLNPQWLEQTVYATDLGSDLLIDPEAVDSLEEYSPSLQAANPNATVGMTITTDAGVSIPDGGNLKTDVTTGVVSYIGSNIAVTVKDIKSFSVTVEAAENSSSKLIGVDHKQEINAVGSNVKPVNFRDNTWGSTLTAVTRGATSVDNTGLSYSTLPAYNTTPIQQSSAQNLADGTYNLKLVFAAKINADKPADSYGTTARVSVVAIPKELIEYRITYNSNGGTGAVAAQTASTTTESKEFTVAAKGNLAKDGYDFLGWAESPSATTAQYIAGSSKITLTKASPTKTLYAVWKESIVLPPVDGTITTSFSNFTYMQEPGLKDYCQNSSTPDKTSGQLVDGRDGKIYWVTVLGSGSNKTCWMTQDLDLDIDKVEFTTNNTGANLYKGSATTWDGGKSTNGGQPIASSSTMVTNAYDKVQWWERDNGAHKAEHTFLGNLYSYQAATAGTGRTYTNDGGENPGSICPAGWKLPLSGSATTSTLGSFKSLEGVGMTSNTTANSPPYYFQYGGYIDGSLYSVGSRGRYWSATSYSSSNVYLLYFDTYSYFSTAYSNARYLGSSVRCVVR